MSFGSGYVLRSSADRAPNVNVARWPGGLGWSIVDRLNNDGAAHGRVLAVWKGEKPVAVVCWHIHGSGPLCVFDAGVVEWLPNERRKGLMALLVTELSNVAAHQRIDRNPQLLHWSLKPLQQRAPRANKAEFLGAARARAEGLGFTALTGRQRPRWMRVAWAGGKAL